MSNQSSGKSNSLTPIAAISASLLGVVTAIWPNAPIIDAVNTAVPQLQIAIPLLLTSIGSIVAVFTRPPRVGKS